MEYENHAHIARRILFFEASEEEKRDVRRITLESGEGKKLLGILVGKSVIIPLSVDQSSDGYLNDMAKENLEVVGTDTLAPIYGACKMLKMLYAHKVEGIYADGDFFKRNVALHLHPNGSIITKDDFLERVSSILNKRGWRLATGDRLAV